ncbi:hypothetical protein LX36DRAFT_100906 [Colletotrichum falcatum]|nr:hypothetical protein LX36DRAFT_100906 [Colletotrichum falcatum]
MVNTYVTLRRWCICTQPLTRRVYDNHGSTPNSLKIASLCSPRPGTLPTLEPSTAVNPGGGIMAGIVPPRRLNVRPSSPSLQLRVVPRPIAHRSHLRWRWRRRPASCEPRRLMSAQRRRRWSFFQLLAVLRSERDLIPLLHVLVFLVSVPYIMFPH